MIAKKSILDISYLEKSSLQFSLQKYQLSILTSLRVQVEHQPNYWICGHHHQNTEEFEIGETKMLTNQLGYVEMGEHLGFDNGNILSV